MAKTRFGIWLIGARGGVATTAIVGLIALQKEWIPTTGLVSELPPFTGLDTAGVGTISSWEDTISGQPGWSNRRGT